MRFSVRELICLFLAMISMEMVLLREYRGSVPRWVDRWMVAPLCNLGMIPFQVGETIIPKSSAVVFEQGGCRVRVETLWWNTFYLTVAGFSFWMGVRRRVVGIFRHGSGSSRDEGEGADR